MLRISLAAAVVALFTACPAPDVVTPEDGAAHLGLVSGQTLTYAIGNGLTETHELKDSGFLFAGGLAVDVFAKQGGFAKDERTLTFGVDVEQVSIVRLFDCNARCGTLSAPIPFLSWPLQDAQSTEGEATVNVTELDATTSVHTERHSTTVSGPEEIVVAAGTFDAFKISWTRTITPQRAGRCGDGVQDREEQCDDGNDVAGDDCEPNCTLNGAVIESALLHMAPDVGVVKHEAFDGTVLELTASP